MSRADATSSAHPFMAASGGGGVSTQVSQLERPLTKAEYADHLRCSIRWLEYRLADGLPSDLIAGKRTFRPSVADEWLRREGHIR
jgi:hypothetical protein